MGLGEGFSQCEFFPFAVIHAKTDKAADWQRRPVDDVWYHFAVVIILKRWKAQRHEKAEYTAEGQKSTLLVVEEKFEHCIVSTYECLYIRHQYIKKSMIRERLRSSVY